MSFSRPNSIDHGAYADKADACRKQPVESGGQADDVFLTIASGPQRPQLPEQRLIS
jgi:hypothetical protein